jgi:hypothetical protein
MGVEKSHNADGIIAEIEWLKTILEQRRKINAGEISGSVFSVPPPKHEAGSHYYNFLQRHNLSTEERLLLILAIAPHVYPDALDIFKAAGSIPSSFGGVIGKNRAFLPTGETFMFIVAGNDIAARIRLLKLFGKEHFFYQENFLTLHSTDNGEPELSGLLSASTDLVDLLLHGQISKPDLSPDFPASLLQSEMNWEDLVLPAATRQQLLDMELWLKHASKISSDPKLGKKLKPGYKALFYGPPGTGKTLSASVIGKKTGKDVYRIDLSAIVSKYIGETEKNLCRLFDRAERKDWILFFDEADALFGKRTAVNDAHDRYANQEVSYLLQRIEYHKGLVILASNMKNNLDAAFLRRFQSVVYFPLPKVEERLSLWQKTFSEFLPPEKNISLQDIAKKYELSGSLITNIVAYSTLKAMNANSPVITSEILYDGIMREMTKEGKTM